MVIKAVDFIFIFENIFNSKLIKLSESIYNNCLVLGNNNLPHLSLCKLLVEDKNLVDLNLVLNNFILKNKFPKLFFDYISVGNLESKKTTALILKYNLDLLEFQKKLVLEIENFSVNCEVVVEMFFEDVDNLTISWTQNSVKDLFRDYNPHISLGFGDLDFESFKFDFIVPCGLVLSAMGKYCSSKKIL
jgi:hypothetical protein